jgi:hypothetical protein
MSAQWLPPPGDPPKAAKSPDSYGTVALGLRRFADLTPFADDAVDVLQVAARLEAAGMSDAKASDTFGMTDVFGLAATLYPFGVGGGRIDRVAPPNPWRVPRGRHAMHGLLYAVPVPAYAAVLPDLARGQISYMLFGLLTVWALTHGVSYLGYTRLARGDRAGAGTALRTGMVVGVLVAALCTVLMLGTHSIGLGSALLTTCQLCYLPAAAALLVNGWERRLAMGVAPMLLAVGVRLVAAGRESARPVAIALVLCSLCAVVVLAVAATGGLANRRVFTLPRGIEAKVWLSQTCLGLWIATLITMPPLVVSFTPGLTDSQTLDVVRLTAIPLSLSMGVAEWALYTLRGRGHALLASIRSPGPFAGAMHRLLLVFTGMFAVVLAALVVLVGLLPAVAGPSAYATSRLSMSLVLAVASLGTAIFLALTLVTFQATGTVHAGCVAAVLAEIVATGVYADHGVRIPLIDIQLIVGTVLAVLFAARALRVVGRVTAHR